MNIKMNFHWKPYDTSDAALVDSWLDNNAIKATGLSDGWENFYNYWSAETLKYDNCEDFCFIVFKDNAPSAVVYLGKELDKLIISEIIIDPAQRSKGYGTAVITELTENTFDIIGKEVNLYEAVVFPNNIASQKAFTKAGFEFIAAHSDGDAWYYQKEKNSSLKTAEKRVDKK